MYVNFLRFKQPSMVTLASSLHVRLTMGAYTFFLDFF